MIKIRLLAPPHPSPLSSLFVRPIQSRIQPHYHQIIQIKMKLAIASLVLGSAAAFQPHSALNAVPKSSSALDMKVRFLFEQANECCITAGSSTIQGRKHDYDQTFEVAGLLRRRAIHSTFTWSVWNHVSCLGTKGGTSRAVFFEIGKTVQCLFLQLLIGIRQIELGTQFPCLRRFLGLRQ